MGNYTAGGIIHGFLYSGGSYTTLNVPGATLTNAMGINNDGLIVGLAIVGGTSHGFLAVPVPEPPSLTLSGIGALRLIGLAWRGRRSPG